MFKDLKHTNLMNSIPAIIFKLIMIGTYFEENIFICKYKSNISEPYVNGAFLRPATQKTTLSSGVASRAVDSVPWEDADDGLCSQTTAASSQPWWAVDLGVVRNITAVIIYTKQNGNILNKTHFSTLNMCDVKH